MKKTLLKSFALLLLVTVLSCNNGKTVDYKYAESPKLLACDFPSGDLYKEAIYSFENDLVNTYDKKNKNITKAYSSFISASTRGRLALKDIASAHSLQIAKALKAEQDLWTTTDGKTTLNYSSSLVDCMVNNIKNKDVKTTFNALLSTNSYKQKLVLPLLATNSRAMQADGNLKSFVAMDLYYTNLLDVKLEDLKTPNPEEAAKTEPKKVEKAPLKAKKVDAKDEHAGHDHN